MRIGPVKVPDPQALLEAPAALARATAVLEDLVSVLREDVDAAGGRRDEIADLRRTADQLLHELREVRGELGWLRANLESIQDRVPGLSPPGSG